MAVDEEIEQAKREMFGDRAGQATAQVVGSGISQVTRITLNFEPSMIDIFGQIAHPLTRGLAAAPPWTENLGMIQRVFGPILERSRDCPGRDRPQCCQAKASEICFPKWTELEDAEWYAQQIHACLTRLNNKLAQKGDLVPAMVADEAFELGCLFTQALNKEHPNVTSGAKVAAGGIKGAALRKAEKLFRKSPEDTVRDVDELLANRRLKKGRAYQLVAEQQGVTEQTIRKEYRSAKKT